MIPNKKFYLMKILSADAAVEVILFNPNFIRLYKVKAESGALNQLFLFDVISNLSHWAYRSGSANSKSFVGKVLLRIKWKFELTVYFKHGILGKL